MSEIDYYRARYYNPTTGRFLSEDPAGFRGGINKYAYTYDDPVDYRDPSGKFVPVFIITGGIGAVAGFGGDITSQLASGTSFNDLNWSEAGIAAGVGGLAGVAAPFLAVDALGAALLGADANLAQTVLTDMVGHKCTTVGKLLFSGATGALGGLIGGPFTGATPFNPNSPWLDQGIVNTLNDSATIPQLFGTGNLLRSFGAGWVSNW